MADLGSMSAIATMWPTSLQKQIPGRSHQPPDRPPPPAANPAEATTPPDRPPPPAANPAEATTPPDWPTRPAAGRFIAASPARDTAAIAPIHPDGPAGDDAAQAECG